MGRGLYWEPVQFYYNVTAIVLSQQFLGHNLITPQGRLLRIALQRRRSGRIAWRGENKDARNGLHLPRGHFPLASSNSRPRRKGQMLQSCYRETAVLSAEEDSPANLDELVKRRHYHGDGLPGTTRLQIKDEPGMRLLSRSSFASEWESRIYNQITRRLLPYLILLYIVSFLDRVNVGFAKLQMAADIGLSDFAYATGAGIFFLGYCLFGLPSSLLLQRRHQVWITRLLIV